MPRPDNDSLREALAEWDSERDLDESIIDITAIVEAARLVASPDTLIVEKVNEEWPMEEIMRAFYEAVDGLWNDQRSDFQRLPLLTQGQSTAWAIDRGLRAALDALLAQQTGDTK